jgi:prepilin-type N-terminal cleavage/methylation domain-containing protein
MFAPSGTGRLCSNAPRMCVASRALPRGFASPPSLSPVSALRGRVFGERGPESVRGFTLLELLIVVGIIGLLLVLIAPAFTTIKGGSDVTSAAYTIKGVLDTARTYDSAKTEDSSNPRCRPACLLCYSVNPECFRGQSAAGRVLSCIHDGGRM